MEIILGILGFLSIVIILAVLSIESATHKKSKQMGFYTESQYIAECIRQKRLNKDKS